MPPADLAARLVESPRFVLAAGMLLTDGAAVAYRVHHDGYGLAVVPNIPGGQSSGSDTPEALTAWCREVGWVPVLEDAGTAGCLLAMLMKTWGKGVMVTSDLPGSFEVLLHDIVTYEGPMPAYGASLGEACAAALIAVWGPA